MKHLVIWFKRIYAPWRQTPVAAAREACPILYFGCIYPFPEGPGKRPPEAARAYGKIPRAKSWSPSLIALRHDCAEVESGNVEILDA